MSSPGPQPAQERFNPFPGLRPFLTDEDYLFFGRENQIAELLTLLRRQRFLAVVGTSGSGKSSIVRAGLLPELLGGGMSGTGSAWEAVTMRPGGDPLLNLAKAFCEADLYDPEDPDTVPQLLATLNRSGSGLIEAARQSDIEEGTHLLILVDQFEELFRLQRGGVSKQDEARSFVRLLLEASAQTEVPVYIVLTMRSDYLGDCSHFSGLAEAVNEGEYLIPRFSRDQLQAAVEGPIKVGGGAIAFRLLQRLLNDVGDQQDQLPVLQHALMRTWDRWESDHAEGEAIDLRHYEAVGTMSEALSVHADEVFSSLGSESARQLATRIFKALTEKGSDNRGIRRPLRLKRLAAIAGSDPAEIAPVLDAFRAPGVTFLMPGTDAELTDRTVIDISHESLMRVWQRLRTWVEDEAQSARIYRRLVDTTVLWEEGKAGLYHDPDLQIAQSWREQAQPNPAWAAQYGGEFETAIRFLEKSHDSAVADERKREAARQRELEQAKALAEAERQRLTEQQKGARRLRKLLAAAAATAAVAVVASVIAAIQMRKAEESESAANALAGQMKASLVQGDFDRSYDQLDSGDGAASLAYLARAMRNDPAHAPAARRAVATLNRGTIPTERLPTLEHEKPISSFFHNQKHDFLLTSSDNGNEVKLWDFESGAQLEPLEGISRDLGTSSLDLASADPEFAERIKLNFAGATPIWLAADPNTPPGDTRYFRKSIGLPADRPPLRADIFVQVDDEFELTLNGVPGGSGNNWQTAYHLGLDAAALADGLDILISANNEQGAADLTAAVFVTFEEGEPLVVTSDHSWQSSTDPGTGFHDSREQTPRGDSAQMVEAMSRANIRMPQWSTDQDRLIGYLAGGKIAAWDVTTSQLVAEPLAVGSFQNIQVAKIEGADDLVAGFDPGEKSVRVWNLTTGEAATPPLKTGGAVTAWLITPDGTRIVALSDDSTLGVWETLGGAEVARFEARPTRATAIEVSPDGNFVVGTDEAKQNLIWWRIGGVRSGNPEWVPAGFTYTTVHFHESGGTVSVFGTGGSGRQRARTFSLAGRETLADITSGENATRMFVLPPSPGATRPPETFGVFGAVTENTVTLWELASGNEAQHLTAPELLDSAFLTPDGRRVIAGSATTGASATAGTTDKKLFVFDLFSGKLALPRPIVLMGASPVLTTPDTETLVTLDRTEGTVRFWDLRTGRQVREPVFKDSISTAIFSRNGRRVGLFQFTSTAYGTQSIGQTAGRLFLEQIGTPPALPDVLAERSGYPGWTYVTPGGERLLVLSGLPDGTGVKLETRDPGTLEVLRSLEIDQATGVNSIAEPVASDDGSRIAVAKSANTAALLDVADGTTLHEFSLDTLLYSLEVSADGKTAACGSQDGVITIWSEDGGERTLKPFEETDPILVLKFNADASLLAAGDWSKRHFVVLDTGSGDEVIPPTDMVNPIDKPLFTPDGKSVIVSQADYKIPMFDLESGERVRDFEVNDWSRVPALSRDGSVLAVGTGSSLAATTGLAYLFDVASGRQLTPPMRTGGVVMTMAISDDGKTAATGTHQSASGFGYAQIWDVATGRPLTEPVTAAAQVNSLAFLPGGRALAVGWFNPNGLDNGLVQLIPVPPASETPPWLPDLAEAVADRRLDPETGVIGEVGGDALATLRTRLVTEGSGIDPGDPWFPWARWIFEDPGERSISPGAPTKMARHLARLRASDDLVDLHQAVSWSPGDALTPARLATRYHETTPANLAEPAKAHWDDTVAWLSDRSVDLAPENLDVWTMRGDLMRRLNRPEAATEATERVLALSPEGQDSSGPNALYQQALALAGEGNWDEAGEAFRGAIDGLDGYRQQLDDGEQPLPLLGVLQRLVPTRVAEGATTAPGGQEGFASWFPPVIEGTFQDFEEGALGAVPSGWRIWNRSENGNRPDVHHLANFQTDIWKDWTVTDQSLLPGNSDVLRRPPSRVVNGREVTDDLMDGRFALAMSQTRQSDLVAFLESPDLDCTGRTDIYLSFHSALRPNPQGMALVEYSIDGGATWLPARYYVHLPFFDGAKSVKDGKPVFDTDGLLDTARNNLPWWIGEGGTVDGGNYGKFVSASRDTPGFADAFEGRPNNVLGSKRVEVIPLPQAAGSATVRLRFGLVGFNAGFWGIDNVGLHAPAEAPPEDLVAAAGGALVRPASDPEKLVNLALELGFGREAAGGEWSEVADQIMAASPGIAGAEAGSGAGAGTNAATLSERRDAMLQARLLAERALALGDAATPAVRAGAGAVLLRILQIDRGWEALTGSGDAAANLADPQWRGTLALAAALRGATGMGFGDREGAYALLSTADALLEGTSGPRQAIRQLIDQITDSDGEAADPDGPILVKRGSAWSYSDGGKLPAEDWYQPGFADRRWFRGPAPLGYGEPAPTTVVQYGPDPRSKFTTTYFRTPFEIEDLQEIGSLLLKLKRDDGVLVYLNGVEVLRDNMPSGSVGYDTFAATVVGTSDEERYFTHYLNSPPIQKGTNWLAVELHQANAGSSDLGFDLELVSVGQSGGEGIFPAANIAAKLETLKVPAAVRRYSLRRLAQPNAGAVGGESLAVALAAHADGTPLAATEAAEMLRLRALAAAAEEAPDEADRLYAEALEIVLSLGDPNEDFDHQILPVSFAEAAQLVRRGPADSAFLFRRLRNRNLPAAELDLLLRWCKNQAGDDPVALGVLWDGLSDDRRHEDALAVADSVLGSLAKPGPGAAPASVLRYKDWLLRREQSLRATGETAAADALIDEIASAPPRDPALGPECLDLTAFYNSSIFDGRRWHQSGTYKDLKGLTNHYDAGLTGVPYDLRGMVYLNSGAFPDGSSIGAMTVAEHIGHDLPDRVDGIPVVRTAKTLRFLASSTWPQEPAGTEVASFIVHYADGTEAKVPLRIGKEITDWILGAGDNTPRSADQTVVKYRSPPDGFALQQTTWENPEPGKVIESIDFVSAKLMTAPFLVAITTED